MTTSQYRLTATYMGDDRGVTHRVPRMCTNRSGPVFYAVWWEQLRGAPAKFLLVPTLGHVGTRTGTCQRHLSVSACVRVPRGVCPFPCKMPVERSTFEYVSPTYGGLHWWPASWACGVWVCGEGEVSSGQVCGCKRSPVWLVLWILPALKTRAQCTSNNHLTGGSARHCTLWIREAVMPN